MASRNQISRLASRIESLAQANASQHASISVIRIPYGMDRERVLAKHRGRWPVNGSGRNPVLVVWVRIGNADADDARRDSVGSREPSPYCDDISWREVAREEMLVCRASGGNARD
jgi:hypothetical protein